MTLLVGESLLFRMRAFAICRMSARRELRSAPLSDQREDPVTLDPETSDPESHVPESSMLGVVAEVSGGSS